MGHQSDSQMEAVVQTLSIVVFSQSDPNSSAHKLFQTRITKTLWKEELERIALGKGMNLYENRVTSYDRYVDMP